MEKLNDLSDLKKLFQEDEEACVPDTEAAKELPRQY